MIPYAQSVDLCLLEKISGMGLPQEELIATCGRLAVAMEILDDPDPEFQAILASVELDTDCGLSPEELQRWRNDFTQVIILGMGGSALGARAALELRRPDDTGPEIHIIDDYDAGKLDRLLQQEDVAKTGLIIVSKSGGTLETISLALIALQRLRYVYEPNELSRSVLAIAEEGDNHLRKMAAQFNFPVLAHDPDLGGRFSLFSATSMLPAAIAGIDISQIRAGAKAVIDAAKATSWPNECDPAVGAAMSFALYEERDITTSILMVYHPKLRAFGLWYRQLWAESLGKEGAGTTPVRVMCPEDHHSQLQLYLDGPVDKFYTALAFNHAGEGPEMEEDLAHALDLPHLAGRHAGDVMAAAQRGTIEAIARRGRPIRTIAMQRYDAQTFGALAMHFILETVFAADLFDVNPYGQPAVEEGKRLTMKYLQVAGDQ